MTLYLRCEQGDIAPRVLLTGDPARVSRIAAALDDAREVSQNREYTVVTGTYRRQAVSAASAGIGAPSTAIALEEMAQLGVKTVVRVGTMMGISVPMGVALISTGAARFEGTSAAYLPMEYPAVPHWGLAQALASAGRNGGLDVQLGVTATYDAFYPDMGPSLVGRGTLDLAPLRRAGVLALDMETSAVHIVSAMLGMAAAAMCLVTVRAEPFTALESAPRFALEDQLIGAILDGITAFEG